MMNNTYYAYVNIENYKDWIELFDLIELEDITQKRIISIISGCVLPIVSLSFVHLLVDLLKDDNEQIKKIETKETNIDDDKSYLAFDKKKEYENANVFDAVPLTKDQEKEIEKKQKKSEFELAKEEMQKAVQKLENYNEELEKDGNS